jgi:hypothetical protein
VGSSLEQMSPLVQRQWKGMDSHCRCHFYSAKCAAGIQPTLPWSDEVNHAQVLVGFQQAGVGFDQPLTVREHFTFVERHFDAGILTGALEPLNVIFESKWPMPEGAGHFGERRTQHDSES